MVSDWKVIFKGEILPGFDQDAVKLEFANLLKLNEEKAKKLFSGKAVILKKELPLDKAEHYKRSFELKGIKVYLEQESKTIEVDGFTLSLQPTEKQNTSEINDDLNNKEEQSSYSHAGFEQNGAKVDADFGLDNKGQNFNESYFAPSGVEALYSDGDDDFVEAPPVLSLSFEGRYGRCNYANASLVTFFLAIFIKFLSVLGIAFTLIFTIVLFIYCIRLISLRLHDLNLSGWYSVLGFLFPILLAIGGHFILSLISYYGFVILLFAYPGKPQSNYYGPPSEQGHPIGIILMAVFMIFGLFV